MDNALYVRHYRIVWTRDYTRLVSRYDGFRLYAYDGSDLPF